jgi:hypothetical protein
MHGALNVARGDINSITSTSTSRSKAVRAKAQRTQRNAKEKPRKIKTRFCREGRGRRRTWAFFAALRLCARLLFSFCLRSSAGCDERMLIPAYNVLKSFSLRLFAFFAPLREPLSAVRF